MENTLLTPEEKEELLKKVLIDKQIITQEKLEQLLQKQRDLVNKAKQDIGGTLFLVDQVNYKIIGIDFSNGNELFTIPLSNNINVENLKNIEWDNRGASINLFDIETCKKIGDITFSPTNTFGFIINQDKYYFYTPDIENNEYLGIVNNFNFGAIPLTKTSFLPFDCLLSRSKKLLIIGDRAAGRIYLIDLINKKLMGNVAVRSTGSNKAINIAISENKGKIYVTDNQTSAITIVNLADLKAERKSLTYGILGNLVVTPDEKFIYLIVIKPAFTLKIIDVDKLGLVKDIPLKGDSFSSNTDDPVDLMTISPDGNNLLLMTYLNEPTPFLPIITVINIPNQKTTQRFSIKDGLKPISLGFGIPNPIKASKKELKELLIEENILTYEQYNEISRTLKKEEEETKEEAKELEVEQIALEFQAYQPQEEEDEEDEITYVPKKAPFMNISPAADELIADICVGLFYQQTDIDLTDVPEAIARIRTAAEKARKELEWYDAAIIKLTNLYQNKNLKTLVTRETIEEMLRTAEFDELVKQGIKTIAKDCPNCGKPLLGSYVCRVCGYEVEKPEDIILESGVIKLASLEPLANLQRGHFLLVDTIKGRVLEIDTKKNIFWEYSKSKRFDALCFPLEYPRSAARLKNRNTLICDMVLNTVVEITPRGRIYWQFDTKLDDEHNLSKPVCAIPMENRDVLIVDQGNHRVIEVDRDQFIKWQYGKRGEEGIEEGLLCEPSYVQRLSNGITVITDSGNNRVIKVEKDKIIWQYGNENNEFRGGAGNGPNQLCYPISAYEFIDGNMLIVDAGNMRVIEINTNTKEVVWEYKTNEGETQNLIGEPILATRLKNFNILILGETNVIEVEKDSKKVVWQCNIADLTVSKLFSVQEVKIKKAKVKHGTTNPYLKIKEEAKGPSLQDKIKALIEQRKGQKPLSDKAHVSITPGAILKEELELALAERSRNRVIKVDRKGTMKYKFGEGEEQLKHPHQAELLKDNKILIADTERFRVIEVDLNTNTIVWQYGTTDTKGQESNMLGLVRHAIKLNNGNTLIADSNRVIEITPNKEIVWTFRNWEILNSPYYVMRLDNGNTLITDWGNHVVMEINLKGEVVWQYGTSKKPGKEKGQLMYPECAVRLNNNNTLIADTRNNRVIEVNTSGEIVFEYVGEGLQKLASPTYVKRLDDGHTVIVHSNNRQIIEIDNTGKLLWKYMLPFEKK